MAFRRRFEFGLAWRTAVLVGAIWLFVAALRTPDLAVARFVAGAIAFAALTSLWAYIRRTNFQVSRFVESIRFEDYMQRFSDPSGAGFDVLGEALDNAIKQLQSQYHKSAREARFHAAVVDDTPNALIAIGSDGRIEMLNKAARELFARDPIHNVEDLEKLGPEFAATARLPAGTRKITRIIFDGFPQRVLFASSYVARLDESFTLISILPIQSELGAFEMAAQADLVRVLTHEIMNSLTPVISLARSNAEMIAAAQHDGADLAEALSGAETVARRAEGLLRFVESYREFAYRPEVHRRTFKAQPWGKEILRLALANSSRKGIDARFDVLPPGLSINADPELLAQAILNLLRNAVRAVSETPKPLVSFVIAREANGRTRIEISDNGPGIPSERREDIFLPFFTTYKGGSGVGLSFARQVALAHGGAICATEAADGGANLQILL